MPSVQVLRAADLTNFSTQQMVNAKVALAGYPVQDFFQDLDLSILQNRRWDNALNRLKPTFINDGMLEYNFLGEYAFEGGVEFHSFDTKRLNQVGMGVKVSRVYMAAFGIGIFLAALGGAFTAPMISVQPGVSVGVIIISFAVVIIGGLGSIEGAAIGALDA